MELMIRRRGVGAWNKLCKALSILGLRESLVLLSLVSLLSPTHSQGITGAVSTTTGKVVKYARVRFVSTSDAARQFWALTDSLGKYQSVTTRASETIQKPEDFELYQNFPNPFTTKTTIAFSIQTRTSFAITIYDILGRAVKKYRQEQANPGRYYITWNGLDESHRKVSYGLYLFRIEGRQGAITRKMLHVSGEGHYIPAGLMRTPQMNPTTGNLMRRSASGGSFYVVVSNTDSTVPRILEMRGGSIAFQSDTSVNFLVKETFSKEAFITGTAFADSLNGWAVTRAPGAIFKTDDGGITWYGQKTDLRNDLLAISVASRYSVFAVGRSGLIIHTDDGGITWQLQNSDWASSLSGIIQKDELEAWIVGGTVPTVGQRSNVILHTTNAGLSWRSIYSSEEGSLSSISVVDTLLWAVGNTSYDNFGSPLILHSSNNGNQWSRRSLPADIQAPLRDVQFWDHNAGYASGDAGVLATSDGGINWSIIYPGRPNPPCVELAVRGNQDVRAINNGNIIRTENAGQTWYTEWSKSQQESVNLSQLFFLNDSLGWGVGAFATVMKYINGHWTVVSP